MRCVSFAIVTLIGAGAAMAAEPPVVGEVSLSDLQALSAREASFALDDRWSVDVSQDAGAPMDAYVPATPIDTARPRTRAVLSLNLAPDARVQPYIGVGVEDRDYERFSPAKPYDTGGNELANFAATVVGGFNVDTGENWSLKMKADLKKIGFGMTYQLN